MTEENESYDNAEPTTTTALAPVDDSVFEQVADAPAGGALDTFRTKTPWVGFFGEKTKTGREAIVAAGIDENQFYLFDAEPLKLRPFTFHVLKSKLYFSKANNAGKVVAVRPQFTREGWQAGFREHRVSLVAAIRPLPTGGISLVPALMTTRGGLADVYKTPMSLLDGDAKDPAKWAARSTNHAIAAQAKWPGGRFVVTAWGSAEDTDSGNTFYKGHSSVRPSKAEEVMAFNELAANYATQLAPAFTAWQKRCEALEKIGTTPAAAK